MSARKRGKVKESDATLDSKAITASPDMPVETPITDTTVSCPPEAGIFSIPDSGIVGGDGAFYRDKREVNEP